VKLTNKLNLPSPIVRAVSAHEHRGADYSASMLEKSPRQVWLARRHDDEIEEDVSDRIWALIGTACHYIVEKAGTPNTLSEGYLEQAFNVNGRLISVSGTFDLFDGETLSDLKTVSVWQIKMGDAKEAWEKQLNVYAHQLRGIGFNPKALEVIAIARDWSKREASRDPLYPQRQVSTIPLRVWSHEEAEAYVIGRIKAFEDCREMTDDTLPECTAKERWEKPAVYAVMKAGRKSAVKLHQDETAAFTHAAELGKGHSVTHRKGEWVKCGSYCNASAFCSQYQAHLSEVGSEEVSDA